METLVEAFFDSFKYRDKPYQATMEDQIHSWWLFENYDAEKIQKLVKTFYNKDLSIEEIDKIRWAGSRQFIDDANKAGLRDHSEQEVNDWLKKRF